MTRLAKNARSRWSTREKKRTESRLKTWSKQIVLVKKFLSIARKRTKRQVPSLYMSATTWMRKKRTTDWAEPFATRMRSWWNSSKKKQMKQQQQKNTLESNEEISKEDVEIRRLSRREEPHPKRRNNDWKRSEQTKKCIRDKKRAKRLEEIQRVLEDFKGIKNIPGIKSVTKKSAHHQDKEWEKRMHYVTEGNCQCLWGLLQKITTTKNTKKLNKKTKRMKLNAASMYKTKTRVRWWEFQRSRLKSYKLQSTDPKQRQSCRHQRNQSRRHQSMRRCDERNGETDLQRNREAKWIYSRGMAKTENKSDTQKRRRGRCWKPPPDLFFASVVQNVHDNSEHQIISKTWPNPSGRSGEIQKLLPNNRPSCDAQNDWSEILKMWAATIDFMKAFDSITHESIWDTFKSCGIEHDYTHFQKKLHRDKKATVLTDESYMFEIKKGTKLGAPLSSLLFNKILQKALEEDIHVGKRNEEWDYAWATTIMTASQTWDLLTTCSCLHPQKNSSKKCYANSSELQKKWDSESIQERRKFSASKAWTSEKKIGDWWHQSRNINKRRKYKTLGPRR